MNFFNKATVLGAALSIAVCSQAFAQGTLRIGMTASDIPLTTGQADNGGEGMRFMGYTVYDGLINWDLSSATKASDLAPGLAESWGLDPQDAAKTKWIFKLRDGVKFHDGSDFTADAVVWNFDKLLKNDSPQFDQRQSAQGKSRIPVVASYKVVDKLTVEITTKSPDATLPYQLAWIMMSSPAQWEKVGKSATGMNYSDVIQVPFTGFIRHLQCNLAPPAGTNWGYFCDPEMDKLFEQVRNTFDPKAQTAVLEKIHEKYVDEAIFLMVTHDVNARAMSPKVKGFVQAKNWFQDFSPISMDK